MTWKSIRLELEPSRDFPRGSAGRAYLLRLPLGDDGTIDAGALARTPGHATVRRFWPNEPDLFGTIVAGADGWAFAFDRGPDDGETLVRHEPRPIRLGESLLLTEPDGRQRAFRVASLRAFH